MKIKIALTLLMVSMLVACAGTGTSTSASASASTDTVSTTNNAFEESQKAPDNATPVAVSPSYKIGVDDIIKIQVWKNPDLSVDEVPVRPDGNISVPLIGDIKVGGKTPAEVSTEIEGKLSVFLKKPRVAVLITELAPDFLTQIRVTGAVETPLTLKHRPGMTVLDAILEAGGVTKFASAAKTKIYRKSEGNSSIVDVDLNKILRKGDLSSNYDLMPGDIITVPERGF